MWKHGEYNGFSWCIKPFDDDGNFYSEDVKNVYKYLITTYN